jgi:hypothetical protein
MGHFDTNSDHTPGAEPRPLPALDSPEVSTDDLAAEPLEDSGFEGERPSSEFE